MLPTELNTQHVSSMYKIQLNASRLRQQEFQNEDWMSKRCILQFCWAFNAFILWLLSDCYYCYDYCVWVSVGFPFARFAICARAHTEKKSGLTRDQNSLISKFIDRKFYCHVLSYFFSLKSNFQRILVQNRILEYFQLRNNC